MKELSYKKQNRRALKVLNSSIYGTKKLKANALLNLKAKVQQKITDCNEMLKNLKFEEIPVEVLQRWLIEITESGCKGTYYFCKNCKKALPKCDF